jgi:hypothetical protein
MLASIRGRFAPVVPRSQRTRQEASTTSDDLQPAGLADEYALHEYALLPVEASSVEVVSDEHFR